MIKLNELMHHLTEVVINDEKFFYFSYSTCIAFQIDNQLFISENVWSSTTGKHLNRINPDKTIRMNHEDFENALAQVVI
jgi:hypothetical protein